MIAKAFDEVGYNYTCQVAWQDGYETYEFGSYYPEPEYYRKYILVKNVRCIGMDGGCMHG